MDNDQVNWNDYEFNFDDEFGAAPQQPLHRPAPQPRRSGAYSIDKMRRVHDGERTQQPVYDDRYAQSYAPDNQQYAPMGDRRYAPAADRQYAPTDGRRYAPEAYPMPNYVPQDAGDAYEQEPPRREKPPKQKKKKHGFWRFLKWLFIIFLLLTLLTAAVLWLTQKMPQTDSPIGTRKKDCCAVLLAGTDEGGVRTDTMMVLYVDRANKEMRLLSLPRDTMVNRDNPVPKLNGAYYANGAGEVGMEYLMDYAKDLIGYRPDGYMLIDLNCFEDLVNRMGGVTYEVPMDMYYNDPTQDLYIDLKEGKQHLNGEQAMWLVRFRSGYASADLQRMTVQRDFIKEALSQWKKPWNIFRVPGVLALLQKNTLTDLSWNNITWLGFSAVVCGTSNLETDTLPGEGTYVNGGAYYVEDRSAAAALVNEKYNPYETEITADDLHPYGY